MIDLYTWITPNGLKISIALEELGLDYHAHTIDITRGDQFSPEFRRINPGSKIPAIHDRNTGVTLSESGAILLYLAEKTGRLIPPTGPARLEVIEWLMWQMGGFGPTLGHAHYFLTYNAGQSPMAEAVFAKETRRLYETLDARLTGREHIVGEYSIADIAIWPWVSRYERHKIDLNDFPQVMRWYLALAARPQVRRGYEVPHFTGAIPTP
ncbi:GST-like protein [Rhizobium sp. RU35A]|uniref:glutathione S-transferase family protein n=1 Tax=Rhizobium sp. RU35A TaxID=1907414 RepID=UPI0009539E96|nr:glutathione S-transferase N-terminal domain-containing protein [Rhizobium sp. RU35A]SIR30959.1 GST-like protein [Rhizobium sp. RU35A]